MKTLSPARKILYYCIMTVVLLLIFELLSRAYYYQYLSRHPVAFVQVLRDVKHQAQSMTATDTAAQRVEKAEEMLRPGQPKDEVIALGKEQKAANSAVYKPWVEFAFRDIRGKYINVAGQVRRSIPDRSDTAGQHPFRILFLGGSTTYGFNLTDSETIPSCFVRAYRQTHPHGRPIQVVNMGMPFYYSYQELILLSDLIFRGERPDMVIMLDGLNDCISANNSYRRVPAFAIGIDDSYRPGSKDDEKKLEESPDQPTGISVDSASKAVSRQYIDNITNAHDLAGLHHIPLYAFWQPVPYYNYPNRDKDPICTHTRSERFERIYPLVKTNAATLPYFFFLGDMLENETGLPFIDQIHYSPRFTRTVAEKMLSQIPL